MSDGLTLEESASGGLVVSSIGVGSSSNQGLHQGTNTEDDLVGYEKCMKKCYHLA